MMKNKGVYYNSFWFDTQAQVDEFKRLEGANLSHWPHGAIELAQARSREMGFCGEVLMTALRDWIVDNVVESEGE